MNRYSQLFPDPRSSRPIVIASCDTKESLLFIVFFNKHQFALSVRYYGRLVKSIVAAGGGFFFFHFFVKLFVELPRIAPEETEGLGTTLLPTDASAHLLSDQLQEANLFTRKITKKRKTISLCLFKRLLGLIFKESLLAEKCVLGA